MAESGLFLAFDYGERRIGVAIGNRWSSRAQALDTLPRGETPPWEAIQELIKEWGPQALVVGLPYRRDGSEQPITVRTRAFVRELQKRFGLAVHTMDERWTSVDAASRLRASRHSGRMKRRIRKGDNDATAAQLILQDYLGAGLCT